MSKTVVKDASELAVVAIQDSTVPSFTFLKTAVAKVPSIHSQKTANIFLDEGAQRTLITSRLAKDLCLRPIFREQLILSGFQTDSNKSNSQLYDVTCLSILDLANSPIPVQAIILDHIANPLKDPHRVAASHLPHVRNLQLAHPTSPSSSSFNIDILVGADYFWSIVTDNIVRGKGPTAVSSRLGYLLSGPFNSEPEVISNIVVSVNSVSVESFDLERFWSVEQLGVETPEKDAHTIADKTDSLLVYQRTDLDFVNGQYIAKFPWKKNHPELNSNYCTTI